MSGNVDTPSLYLLTFPYARLTPLSGGRAGLKEVARQPGSAVVWRMGSSPASPEMDLMARRPGGLPLVTILPSAPRLMENPALVNVIQRLRPHGILPNHADPQASELAHVLRRPPTDLPAEVTDYLEWRGIGLDRGTVRLVRRIVELSEQLRSVSGLARSMYMSRRALGRRFMTLGLPVPSHWLQMARLLRVAIRLQNTDDSVFAVGCALGYPDGFSVSNQMSRLFGIRPTQARERLGWEWVFEAWLRREADNGAFAPNVSSTIRDSHGVRPAVPPGMMRRPMATRRKGAQA